MKHLTQENVFNDCKHVADDADNLRISNKNVSMMCSEVMRYDKLLLVHLVSVQR